MTTRADLPTPEADDAPVLAVRDLQISIGDHQVVDGVTLDVGAQEIVALVGESGSGKSLTALAIMGLLSPSLTRSGGSVRLEGREIAGLP